MFRRGQNDIQMLEVDAEPVGRRCRERSARSDVEEDVSKTRRGD